MRDKGKPWLPRHSEVLRDTLKSLEQLIREVDLQERMAEEESMQQGESDADNPAGTDEPDFHDIDSITADTRIDDSGPLPPLPKQQVAAQDDDDEFLPENPAPEPPAPLIDADDRARGGGLFDWDDSGGLFSSQPSLFESQEKSGPSKQAKPGETLDWIQDSGLPPDEPPPDSEFDDLPVLEDVAIVAPGRGRRQERVPPGGRKASKPKQPDSSFPPEDLLVLASNYLNTRLDQLTGRTLDHETETRLRETLREILNAWYDKNSR